MVKYLIKKKMKKEVEEHSKKAIIYTTVALAGVGAYFSYRAVKNYKRSKELEEQQYLEDSEYEIYNEDEIEDRELKAKIDEFNAKRINHETNPHISKEELEVYVKEAEEYKEESEKQELAKEAYKEEEYDKYDYFEDDLSKDK